MTNPYYNNAVDLLPGTKARSGDVDANFDSVEVGFDNVVPDIDRAVKLPAGTADQTLALDAGQRANLVLAFDASGNITAVSKGRWRGDWVTATDYVIGDSFRYEPTGNIYSTVVAHTSGVFATDLAANKFTLAVDVETVTVASAAAVAAAATATTQAGIATTGASTATTQAGISTAAADAAAASYDSFDDRYLGPKAADPTLDNDGNALLTGALYVNTTVVPNEMRFYDGAAWQIAYLPASNYVTLSGVQTLTNKTIDPAGNIIKARVRDPRTSNTALVDADTGKWIDYTSGTFTQTFGARTAGWWAILGNSGSGDIGLTTDGVTYKMYTGEKRYVIYDGTNDYSIVLNAYARVWTASDTWVKPPGYAGHGGRQWAGGGSGRRAALGTGDPICGGAGGSCTDFYFTQAELPATVAFMIGSGGAAQTTNTTNGIAGGSSGFNGVIAYGGAGGANAAADGAHAYISSNTNAAIAGARGTIVGLYGGGNSASTASTVKATVYGGGSGATLESAGTVTSGATTIFGGAGGTTNAAGTAPTAGTAPGGGGGASTNGTASGAGARGELRMWGVI